MVFRLEEKKQNNLFTDGIILYTENHKESTKTLLEPIKEFSIVAGYKINIQKSIVFLFTNNEHFKKKKDSISKWNSIKKNSILRTKLTK